MSVGNATGATPQNKTGWDCLAGGGAGLVGIKAARIPVSFPVADTCGGQDEQVESIRGQTSHIPSLPNIYIDGAGHPNNSIIIKAN